MADDDPEGCEIQDRVEEQAENDPDLFVFTNLADVGRDGGQRIPMWG
ncbi:MAG: hypothetical protein JSR31_01940 [Nitrospira sp.]|nr:hypothetical protein [Nitrospira sp.]